MKALLFSVLLACSVGLNVLLLVAFTAPESVAPFTKLIRPGQSVAGSPSGPVATPPATGAAGGKSTAKWADLQSDDPATLVANLRGAGFSDAEIRAILQLQLGRKVNERRRELVGTPAETPWWRPVLAPNAASLVANPQGLAELRELARQNARLIDSLLGPAPATSQLSPNERMQFADLPPDKIDPLRQLLADYNELTGAITSNALGIYFPEDRAKLKLIEEEKEKDLRALLTPEEYDTYLLRTSNTANTLRSNLQAFQPSEDEFRRIFALQYAFDQQYSTQYGIDADLLRQRAQAQAELNARIKAELSPERAADYERATDGNYRQAAALVARLELPPATATQLWQLQRDTQQQMNALRSNPALTPDARNRALGALQDQVTAQASALLGGQRGLEAYRTNGGQWIQGMVPQTLPAPAR
jgi:hypothetical protein